MGVLNYLWIKLVKQYVWYSGFYGYYEGDLRDNIKSTLASISSRGPDSNGHYYESFNESNKYYYCILD